MNALLLALALQCFSPVFGSSQDEFLGLSLVNRDSQPREFSITATSEDGVAVRTGRVIVPGGGQRALLLNEIAGSASPEPGWISVDSPESACPLYFASGTSDTLAGIDAAMSLSMSIILPHVAVNTGFLELAATDTLISIVNPNTSAVAVTAELVGLDGAGGRSKSLTVPARGSVSARVSGLFADVLPGNGAAGKVFTGYIRLRADKAVAAWQRLETALSRSVLRGRTAEEARSTSLAMIPHFAFGGNLLYGSIVNLINPTSGPVELELSARSDDGASIGETIQLRLAAGESRRESVGSLFRVVTPAVFPPFLVSGYIRIREARGAAFQIIGDVEIFSDALGGRQSSMLSPISEAGSTNWLLPFAASVNSYFTGYSIVNPNELLTVQTDVTVEVVDSNGVVQSKRTASLSPRNRITGMIPAGIASGFIRIAANFPVHVLGTIGTRDNQTLDQLTAIPQ